MIDWLEQNTEVKFLPCGRHPDYRSNMKGAAVAGRAIIPQPFDGRLLGADFKRLRPPIPEYMLFGGMMIGKADIPPLLGRFRSLANFSYAAKLMARYVGDRLRYPRGTRLMMGNALVARLFYSLRKRGVEILFNAPIAAVDEQNGRVAGATIKTADGEIYVKAAKGVVLATGGYGHNRRYREAFMPRPVPVHSMASEFNVGDGIAIGEQLGARIAPDEHRRSGLWTPASVTTRPDGSKGLYPHLLLDRAKPGVIAVNANGERFVNEAVSYHDFVEGDVRRQRQVAVDSLLSDLRCGVHPTYGLGEVYPGAGNLRRLLKAGYLKRGETLENLAGATRRRRAGAAPHRRTLQRLRADRRRYRLRQRRDRAQPFQRRRRAQAESLHRSARNRALLRPGNLARRNRGQHRPVDGSQMRACSTATASRSPASMRAATTWRR